MLFNKYWAIIFCVILDAEVLIVQTTVNPERWVLERTLMKIPEWVKMSDDEKNNVVKRKTTRYAENGNEYLLSSLPEEIQSKFV